jgi:hypothetical protein
VTDGQLLTPRPSAAPAALEYCGDAPHNDQCGSYSPARSYFACSRPTIRFSSTLHAAETRFGPFENVRICQFERRTEHNDAVKISAFAGGAGLLQDHLGQLVSGPRFLCHSGSRCRSTDRQLCYVGRNYHGHGNLPSGHRRTITSPSRPPPGVRAQIFILPRSGTNA